MGGETQVWETMLCLGLRGLWLSDPDETKAVTDTADGGVTLGTGTGPSHWGPNGTRSSEPGGPASAEEWEEAGGRVGLWLRQADEVSATLPSLASAFPNILVIYLFHCETVLDKNRKGASFNSW